MSGSGDEPGRAVEDAGAGRDRPDTQPDDGYVPVELTPDERAESQRYFDGLLRTETPTGTPAHAFERRHTRDDNYALGRGEDINADGCRVSDAGTLEAKHVGNPGAALGTEPSARRSAATPIRGNVRPMPAAWPALRYEDWSATCDTLHAHTQLLGKLAVAVGLPEPQLQHAALRLTARGWETAPLPAPDGSGALVVALDLHRHEAVVEHSGGRSRRVALAPDRPVGEVTRAVLDAVRRLAGPVEINPVPQEVAWTIPLDEDDAHRTYDPARVETYFAAATQAALALAAFRAAYRGRSTPVNAWWGSFDLAVSLFSGRAADPPSSDFIMRNAMDAQEVAVGWWPGDARYPGAAFYAYAHPAPDGFATAALSPPAARWEEALGEYLLDWEDVRAAPDPRALALEFARSAFRFSCAAAGDWDPDLAATAAGDPPPATGTPTWPPPPTATRRPLN